jgi:alpha/beta superfamily hydrolase
LSFTEEPFAFESDGFRLEGLLHRGEEAIAAVVLHPHPHYGGDMHNRVVGAVCETFAERGATTLRFNFRGTGRSEGQYGGGHGEADDSRAAIAALRENAAAPEIILAGYSFGALIASRLASDVSPRALVLISPPVATSPLPPLPAALDTLVLAGADDHIAPADVLSELASERVRVVAVPGVDHSWWPGNEALTKEIAAFVVSLSAA